MRVRDSGPASASRDQLEAAVAQPARRRRVLRDPGAEASDAQVDRQLGLLLDAEAEAPDAQIRRRIRVTFDACAVPAAQTRDMEPEDEGRPVDGNAG
ncbi:MAG TPA: hypothetical protein VFM58_08060 [Solirubrobacteraceae bacterium]|nr:hypothetical protein [Solirubrobacteraceae bacterium]